MEAVKQEPPVIKSTPPPPPIELPQPVRDIIKLAPASMSGLMERYIAQKNLNDRAKIRLMMKALLDLIAVDTEYPPIAKKRNEDFDLGEERDPVRQNENILGGETA